MSTGIDLSRPLVLLCRVMQGAVVALAAVLALGFWLSHGADMVTDSVWRQLTEEQRAAVAFTGAKRMMLHGVAGILVFTPLLVLFGLWRVFGAFARGPAISVRAVGTLRFLGVLLLARALINLLGHPLMLLVMTYDNPPGMRVVSLNVSSSQAFDVLFGVMFVMIGHVLTRAVAAAEENRQFV